MATVSIGEALGITLFSMITVFVVLLAISFLIDLMRKLVHREDKKVIEPKKLEKVETEELVEETMDEEELVAVIAAAVAASMGVGIPDINIRSIRRIGGSESNWQTTARQEQVLKNI